MRNLEFLEQLFQAHLALAALEPLRFEDGHYVVFNRELAEDGGLLREVAYAEAGAPVHGLVRHLDVVEEYVARIGAHHAHDHVEGGCLAGTVGAKQPDDFALRHADGNIAHHLAAAIDLAQFICTDCAYQTLHGFLSSVLTFALSL